MSTDYSRLAEDCLRWRPAAAADLPGLVTLIHNAYRGKAAERTWTTEADLVTGQRIDEVQLQCLLDAGQTRVMLASDAADELLGCFELAKRPQNTAYFGLFAIQPAAHGLGLGRRMLAAAEGFAQEWWGCTAIEMTVIAQRSELIGWYERRGYERTGEHRAFPYRQSEFGTPQRADLFFEVLRKSL